MPLYQQTIGSNANFGDWLQSGAGSFGAGTIICGDVGGNDYDSCLRFTNVTIWKNAPIAKAQLEFYSDEGAGSPSILVNANDADSPSVPADAAAGVALVRTTAGVNMGTVTNGQVKTLNVKPIVEELIARAGWAINNSMMFIFNSQANANPNYICESGGYGVLLARLTIQTRAGGVVMF